MYSLAQPGFLALGAVLLLPNLGIRLTRDSWPDDRRDLKCRKARPQRPRLQMSEALMLQSVPPYVDTPQPTPLWPRMAVLKCSALTQRWTARCSQHLPE